MQLAKAFGAEVTGLCSTTKMGLVQSIGALCRCITSLLTRLVDTHGGTAKAIAARNPAVRPRDYLGRFAWLALSEALVRSSLVRALDELVQHPRQMLPAEDQ